MRNQLTYLEVELLVAGPPLPNKLARPGPARAPVKEKTRFFHIERSAVWPSANAVYNHEHGIWLKKKIHSPSPPSPVGPISCMSWLWLILPRRLCKPPSPYRKGYLKKGNSLSTLVDKEPVPEPTLVLSALDHLSTYNVRIT